MSREPAIGTKLPKKGRTVDEPGRTHDAGPALRLGWRVVGGMGAGVVMALCFPPFNLPLMPVALALLVWLLRGATARHALYLGMSCGMAFFALTLRWLATMFGAAAITLWALSALFPMVACALTVVLQRRLPRIPLWLLFAITWTAAEYFRSELMILNFAWMGLGYSLVDSPWLVAGASLIGSYGLTFLLCAFGVALYLCMVRSSQEGYRGPWPLVTVGALLLWLLLYYAPRAVPSPRNPLAVRLVQGRSEEDDDLFRLSRVQTGIEPAITIWPEDSYISDPHKTPHLWEKLSRLPRDIHGYFLFGARDQLDPRDDDVFRKAAYLLDPQGNLVGKHFKNHLVHFFKEGIPGTEAHPIATPIGRLGVEICFDMDYPDVSQKLTDEGAEVLLVPSDNPMEWGPLEHIQHKQLFQMRAVECNRWLATADVAGNTFAVAPTGRIIRSVTTTEPTILDVTVGRQSGRTLFVLGGWRLGALCLVALCGLCLVMMLPDKRHMVRSRGIHQRGIEGG